mmetsp:Transcript_18298/g.49253  ORF Transcript_18298/g.49253 Transcript_18298/m.49253 type:complete len:205 (-) Transcript_18298:479-1093(-)
MSPPDRPRALPPRSVVLGDCGAGDYGAAAAGSMCGSTLRRTRGECSRAPEPHVIAAHGKERRGRCGRREEGRRCQVRSKLEGSWRRGPRWREEWRRVVHPERGRREERLTGLGLSGHSSRRGRRRGLRDRRDNSWPWRGECRWRPRPRGKRRGRRWPRRGRWRRVPRGRTGRWEWRRRAREREPRLPGWQRGRGAWPWRCAWKS